jgi:hypothetical protein
MAMSMGMGMGMGMNAMGMNMGMMSMGMGMGMGMPMGMGMGMSGMGMARTGSWAPGMASSSMPEQPMFGMGPMSLPMMGNTPDGMAADMTMPMSGSAIPDHMLPPQQPPSMPHMHLSASAPFLSHAHSMPVMGAGNSPLGPSKLSRAGTAATPLPQQELPALSQTFFTSNIGGMTGAAAAGGSNAGTTGIRESSPEPDLGALLGTGLADDFGPTLNRNSSNIGLLDGPDALLLGTGGPSSLDLLDMGADLGGAGGLDDPLAALDPLLLEADCGPAMSVGRPGTNSLQPGPDHKADWLTAVDSPVMTSCPPLGLSLRKTPSLVNMITASMEVGGAPANGLMDNLQNDLMGDAGTTGLAAADAPAPVSKRSGAAGGRANGSSRASRRR